MTTASFDVFDTALTRLIGSPRQVFVETGRRLQRAGRLDIEAEAYAAAREQAGWSLTPDLGRHPSLQRIADELTERLGLRPELSKELLATELDVELDVCRAVPGFAQRAAQGRRDTGRGIVFVSDTPLPADFLRDLLVREGLFVDGDRLYTSAAYAASKQDGALFDVVAADLGTPAGDFVHVGDDRWADLAHGRQHGWAATLDTRARLTGREHRLDQAAIATDGLGPQLAGAARLGRLAATEDGIDPALAAIAGAVALPLLAGFGLWVLRQAEVLDLDRLYFVARDGEVFQAVTRQLAAPGSSVECRYLHGSRLAWQLAGAAESAPERHDRFVRYLDQEGVTAADRVGLVDVGWTGRAARALEDVLVAAGRPRPAAHLFLGLLASSPEVMGADLRARSHGWLLDEPRGRTLRTDGADPVMVVESFCMGSEGHTVGYDDADGRVVARLAATTNPAVSRWPFADYRRALQHALDALLDGPAPDATIDLRPLVGRALMDFWHHPTRAEAAVWGAQPYGEDIDNLGAHPLATPVGIRRMLTRLGIGRAGWREPTYWLAGTVAVSGQPWRRTLLLTMRAGRVARWLPSARARLRVRLRGELAMRRRPRS